MARCSILLLTALLAPALALTPAPAPARACQLGCTPINLVLSYLPGLSNWGPEKATGIAELVLAEGEARGRVIGLPRLTNEAYGVWLIATSTDDAIAFGTFNTDQTQRAQFRFILPQEIPERPWNLLLITVQPAGEPAGRQSDKRSIGGYFVGPDQRGQQPRELPNTGGDGAQPGAAPGDAPAPPAGPVATLAPVARPSPRTGAAPAADGGPPAPAGAAPVAPAGPPPGMIAGLAAVSGLAGLLAGWTLHGRTRRRR